MCWSHKERLTVLRQEGKCLWLQIGSSVLCRWICRVSTPTVWVDLTDWLPCWTSPLEFEFLKANLSFIAYTLTFIFLLKLNCSCVQPITAQWWFVNHFLLHLGFLTQKENSNLLVETTSVLTHKWKRTFTIIYSKLQLLFLVSWPTEAHQSALLWSVFRFKVWWKVFVVVVFFS